MQPTELAREACQAFYEHRYSDAVSKYEELLSVGAAPTDYVNCGLSYYFRRSGPEDYAEARRLALFASDKEPGNAYILGVAGLILLRGEDINIAGKLLSNSLLLDPDDKLTNWHYIQFLIASGKPDEALQRSLAQLYNISRSNEGKTTFTSRFHIEAGQALLKLNRLDEGLTHFYQAISEATEPSAKNDAAGWIISGLEDAGRWDEAAEKIKIIHENKVKSSRLGIPSDNDSGNDSLYRRFTKTLENVMRKITSH